MYALIADPQYTNLADRVIMELWGFFRCQPGQEEKAYEVAMASCKRRVSNLYYEARIQAHIDYNATYCKRRINKTQARKETEILTREQYLLVIPNWLSCSNFGHSRRPCLPSGRLSGPSGRPSVREYKLWRPNRMVCSSSCNNLGSNKVGRSHCTCLHQHHNHDHIVQILVRMNRGQHRTISERHRLRKSSRDRTLGRPNRSSSSRREPLPLLCIELVWWTLNLCGGLWTSVVDFGLVDCKIL